MTTVVGVDYSLTSPAICIHVGDEWHIRNCSFHFLTDRPKLEGKNQQFYGTLKPAHSCDEQRHDQLSGWAYDLIAKHDPSRVVIEGYSFGSVGRVFNLAENCGLLKYKLWKGKVHFDVAAPTTIKKFSTGKGNANKERMQEAFIAETSVDVKFILGISDKQWNPSSDIIDAYFLAKYAFNLRQTGELP